MNKLVFPWPPKEASPNYRSGHWGPAYRAKKKYREDCAVIAQDYDLPPQDSYTINITFHTKTKRRPDQDNLIASMKSGLDGIADALGVDDKIFKIAEPKWGKPVKGGAVLIEIT